MKTVVISLCDKTGIMVMPWARAGHLCLCIDLQHSIRATKKGTYKITSFKSGGEIHFIYGDARSWKPTDFHPRFFTLYKIVFVASFPVCTNLSGSGAQDWKQKGIPLLMDGLLLFNTCELVAAWSGAPYCTENPVGCIPKHYRRADFTFHPWFYGDLYQKNTCLWTGNGFVMPIRKYITKPKGVSQKIHTASPGPGRSDLRSETPAAFAAAVYEANKLTYHN